MKQVIYIYRSLRKSTKLILINVLGMALGLLVAGVILAFVYQEFNYDSDSVNSEDIYRVILKDSEDHGPYTYGPLAEALKTDFPEIEDAVRVSIYYGDLACSTGDNKFNEPGVIFADPNFFSIFSFPLIRGDREECLTSPGSVLISESAAIRYFGDDDPLGKQLRIGKHKNITVTGVYQDFKPNSNFKGDLVLPLKRITKITNQIWIEPSWKYESDIHTFVLLSDQTNVEEFTEKGRNFIANYIENSNQELSLQRLKDMHVETQFFWESVPQTNKKYLYIFITVAIVILIISSANFLFLYLGSESLRSVNTGVRKVCGASKLALFSEHLREVLSILLLSVVFAVGLYLIYDTFLLRHLQFLPKIVSFDYKLGIIILAVLIGVASISGIYPSLILSSQSPVNIFNSNRTGSHGRINLINLLVIGQFTLCIVLIGTILLMQKQSGYLKNCDTGFAKDELITIPLNMTIDEGINGEKFDAFAGEVKKIPGVKNISVAFSSPSSVETSESEPDWEGRDEGQKVKMNWNSVSYDYFETIGVNIVEGRSFNRNFPGDIADWDKNQAAFILNRKAVEEMGLTDPIGKEFRPDFRGPIVGVVEDYNFKSLHSGITPMYFYISPFHVNEIIVRADLSIPTIIPEIEGVWNRFVPEYPIEFNFVNNQIKALYRQEQNLANTLGLFSVIAIIIACVGLFTLTILSINKRIKEIGIRKVNGAKVSEILAMLNKDFIKWVVIAFVIAVPIAYYAMNNWLENFAYKTTLSWWVFVLAGAMALAIALITVSWQSWKAATRNPVEALRYE